MLIRYNIIYIVYIVFFWNFELNHIINKSTCPHTYLQRILDQRCRFGCIHSGWRLEKRRGRMRKFLLPSNGKRDALSLPWPFRPCEENGRAARYKEYKDIFRREKGGGRRKAVDGLLFCQTSHRRTRARSRVLPSFPESSSFFSSPFFIFLTSVSAAALPFVLPSRRHVLFILCNDFSY